MSGSNIKKGSRQEFAKNGGGSEKVGEVRKPDPKKRALFVT